MGLTELNRNDVSHPSVSPAAGGSIGSENRVVSPLRRPIKKYKKLPIWLVWTYEANGVYLRAVDTDLETAALHKEMLEREARDFDIKRRVQIEERETNHCYGACSMTEIRKARTVDLIARFGDRHGRL